MLIALLAVPGADLWVLTALMAVMLAGERSVSRQPRVLNQLRPSQAYGPRRIVPGRGSIHQILRRA
jgi:hypothetical protein